MKLEPIYEPMPEPVGYVLHLTPSEVSALTMDLDHIEFMSKENPDGPYMNLEPYTQALLELLRGI